MSWLLIIEIIFQKRIMNNNCLHASGTGFCWCRVSSCPRPDPLPPGPVRLTEPAGPRYLRLHHIPPPQRENCGSAAGFPLWAATRPAAHLHLARAPDRTEPEPEPGLEPELQPEPGWNNTRSRNSCGSELDLHKLIRTFPGRFGSVPLRPQMKDKDRNKMIPEPNERGCSAEPVGTGPAVLPARTLDVPNFVVLTKSVCHQDPVQVLVPKWLFVTFLIIH